VPILAIVVVIVIVGGIRLSLAYRIQPQLNKVINGCLMDLQ
jgi:hypothetical protein